MIVGSSRRVHIQFNSDNQRCLGSHCALLFGVPLFTLLGSRVFSVFRVSLTTHNTTFQVRVIMHCVARSLATAGCTKASSAARLAACSLRSASVVRPPARLAAAVGASGAPSRRTIHVRVPLPYKIEDGLGDFLSPEALKVIAEDYQQGLLDRLNEQIKGALSCLGGNGKLLASSPLPFVSLHISGARAGTKYENMPVAQIVISTAPHESQTLAFNYASLALNNSFFLHHLVSPRTTFNFFKKGNM